MSYFFLHYQSPSSSLCTVFDSISSNIYEVLSINPSAVFVFGDFNVHHKDWFTYSVGTERPGEVGYNFSVSNDHSRSPALLDFFLSSDPSICSIVAFPPLGNSDCVVVSVSIDFYHIQKGMTHFIALLKTIFHLRDVPWRISLNSVLLLLVNFVSGFRLELMYISLIESIKSSLTHLHGFQLLLLLPHFIEITFFVCSKRINLLNLK